MVIIQLIILADWSSCWHELRSFLVSAYILGWLVDPSGALASGSKTPQSVLQETDGEPMVGVLFTAMYSLRNPSLDDRCLIAWNDSALMLASDGLYPYEMTMHAPWWWHAFTDPQQTTRIWTYEMRWSVMLKPSWSLQLIALHNDGCKINWQWQKSHRLWWHCLWNGAHMEQFSYPVKNFAWMMLSFGVTSHCLWRVCS